VPVTRCQNPFILVHWADFIRLAGMSAM
jgi:hypothetical protein